MRGWKGFLVSNLTDGAVIVASILNCFTYKLHILKQLFTLAVLPLPSLPRKDLDNSVGVYRCKESLLQLLRMLLLLHLVLEFNVTNGQSLFAYC